MTRRKHAASPCSFCSQMKPCAEMVPGDSLRDVIVQEIQAARPDWSTEGSICLECLNRFRTEYFHHLLEQEKGELSVLELQVLDAMREQESIAANVNETFEGQLTTPEKLSDWLASFGGSWSFLTLFMATTAIWMMINSHWLQSHPFDPYPFILLNLVLSCLAAIQAPVILMSQKRQESKDRMRSEYDFQVNFRAELEIRLLHAKLDQLLSHQWQRLLEIQQVQMEMMEQLTSQQRSPRE